MNAANVFSESNVDRKILMIEEACHKALLTEVRPEVPMWPARDVEVREIHELPLKPGFQSVEGQARLLHDLASIELQAMELALRTLVEFPEAPRDFREQLAELTLSEARHLKLCLRTIDSLGFQWGQWPVHLGLWQAVSFEDSLLDRLLIVHRYLEGSGLDAGDSILRRLSGVDAKRVRMVVDLIVREEVDHVAFGSRWYQKFCAEACLDVEADFSARIRKVFSLVPRREKIARELRKRAGFSESEILLLEDLRRGCLAGERVVRLTT